MKNWLNKPFPMIESLKRKILFSLLFGLFIFLFLYIFQPFDIPNFVINFLFYGIITSNVILINFLVIPFFFKEIFNPDNWNIKKQLYFTFWQMLTISIFNFLYADSDIIYVEINHISKHSIFDFIFFTFIIGIFPSIFHVMYFENKLSNKHQKIAVELTKEIHKPVKQTQKTHIHIISENQKENIILELENFICMRSEGNYIDIFYIENEQIKKKLIRSSLTKMIEQFINFNFVKRCHRSYIVNLNNVKKVSGNARNYNLHIDFLDFTIPVSRNFPKSIIENIKV